MSWKPIVVGVDPSPEAAQAAAFGYRLAQAVGTTCHLVHGTPLPWIAMAEPAVMPDLTAIREAVAERAREEILLAARGAGVPQDTEVLVHFGRAIRVLDEVIAAVGAGLLVLGGKRHATLERWLGGSTAQDAVRTLSVPVLATRHPPRKVRRILAAADLSAAAKPTIAFAERLADVWRAELRVVSVLEPLPLVAGTEVESPEYRALWEEMLRRDVWPLVGRAGVTTMVRHGPVVDVLRGEAVRWPADLLVVGSHGKGWVDRLLLGSVTERLLNELPTSLVVVPTAAPVVPEPAQSRPGALTGYIP